MNKFLGGVGRVGPRTNQLDFGGSGSIVGGDSFVNTYVQLLKVLLKIVFAQ